MIAFTLKSQPIRRRIAHFINIPGCAHFGGLWGKFCLILVRFFGGKGLHALSEVSRNVFLQGNWQCPKGCHVGDSVIDHSTLVAWPAQIFYDELQEWSNPWLVDECTLAPTGVFTQLYSLWTRDQTRLSGCFALKSKGKPGVTYLFRTLPVSALVTLCRNFFSCS